MNIHLLVTVEILLTIVAPLVLLYVRGTWPLRKVIPCLLSIPTFVWYLTYSPLHEFSHVAGTFLAGGTVTDVKWIPGFWVVGRVNTFLFDSRRSEVMIPRVISPIRNDACGNKGASATVELWIPSACSRMVEGRLKSY